MEESAYANLQLGGPEASLAEDPSYVRVRRGRSRVFTVLKSFQSERTQQERMMSLGKA